jgi:hypothetical protein
VRWPPSIPVQLIVTAVLLALIGASVGFLLGQR